MNDNVHPIIKPLLNGLFQTITKKELEFDYSEIDNIDMANVTGYPDFTDAYIVSADYKGEPMTEDQLDILNEDTDFLYEQALEWHT